MRLKSAISQPYTTFGDIDLHKTLFAKAAALGFSIVMNHPFIDGNKRTAHLAVESFLDKNGFEINADVREQEIVMLRLASGEMKRGEFTEWLNAHATRSA